MEYTEPTGDDREDSLVNPAPHAALRDRVWLQTMRLLARRRRLRRLGHALVLVTCYIAGLGTMWLANQPLTSTPQIALRTAEPAFDPPALTRTEAEPVAELFPADDSRSGAVPGHLLERWAAAVPQQSQAGMYRRAGDRYIEQDLDLESALRCYARALESGWEDPGTGPADNDHWLLMALKEARQKETHNGNDDG